MNETVQHSTPRNHSGIQVISRAASILRVLRDERDGLSLAQIATRVQLPRSTVQRIVHALVSERLLMAASPNGRVRLGTEITALANNSKIDVVEVAHPLLAKLSEQVGETVDLAVLRGDHLLFLDQIAGTNGPPPVFLYAPTERLGDAARRLDGIGVRALLVVTAEDDDGEASRQLQHTPFVLVSQRRADPSAFTFRSMVRR